MPQPLRTRERQLSGPLFKYHATWQSAYGYMLQEQEYSFNARGRQITVSEGHQWPPPLEGKLIDRGGPFYTTKSYLASPRVMPFTKLRSYPNEYNQFETFEGVILPNIPGLSAPNWDAFYPPSMISSDDDLLEKGTTAISRCKPTNSVANLGTTLAETMREGIPALVGKTLLEKKTKSLLGKGAGEFLNISFGWMPLVSDVKKAAKAIRRSDDILAQYERDAGNVVRRKYYFPLEKTHEDTVILSNTYPTGFGILQNIRMGLEGDVIRRRTVERKTWFSGAFTYYLPSDYDSRNKIKELRTKADLLLSTDLTPELLWNIGPWSWLTDWFANTGDVISNLQDFLTGELVMRYGYIMETVKVSDTYTHKLINPPTRFAAHVTELTFVTETKRRLSANPFGFGLQWNGLSPFQQAILAALGITRTTR